MAEEKNGVKTFYAESRAAWRTWLIQNHGIEKNVLLIIYRVKSGIPSVTYDESVDEALCFGWIDSTRTTRDEQSHFQFFAKRNPKSNWSRVNKAKIERLMAENLMEKAGLDMVELAKKTGTWTALDDVENGVIPDDLQAEFDKNPTAKGYFDAFPRSAKRGILEWLLNAKQLETRAKRINEIITLAEKNERANLYVKK
jgi:uncharacterized protein YdeI (YjbR/CyaY-like superfamily)